MPPTRKSPNQPPAGTQSVVRAIRMLKAFDTKNPEWNLADLCADHGLTKPTAHRLLAALVSEELLARDPKNHTYRLGPAAIALGTMALGSYDLRSQARPILEALGEDLEETVTLEILTEREVLIIDEVTGRRLLMATPETGTRWPAHATATGKSLLACLPQPALHAVLRRDLESWASSTITDAEALSEELREIRARGWAIADGELEDGFMAVAAAFFGPLGKAAGAFGVGGPAERLRSKTDEIGERLRRAADDLSRELGYEG